jgi:hypothetical protein
VGIVLLATLRIGAKVKSFVSTDGHLRQPNKQAHEQGVDKSYCTIDQIPFNRAKAIHILHITEDLQACPTYIFLLDIIHKNAITKLKAFEGS